MSFFYIMGRVECCAGELDSAIVMVYLMESNGNDWWLMLVVETISSRWTFRANQNVEHDPASRHGTNSVS
jgi:hypothetical protein